MTAGLLARDTGAAGFVKIIPPLPALDVSDGLTMFVAITLA